MTKNNSKKQQQYNSINDITVEPGDLIEFVESIWLITNVKNKYNNLYLDIVCLYGKKPNNHYGSFIKEYNMTSHDQNCLMYRGCYHYNIIK